MTFINEIYDFNLKAGLLDKPYNDFLESSFQIEEALEGFPDMHLDTIGSYFNLKEPYTCKTPKELARFITITANVGSGGPYSDETFTGISDVDRLDKAIDALVFAVGSMSKLKLTPEQITKAISVVTQANLQKLSMPKDEFGKLTKPADFIGPEVQLQSILDERTV